MLQQLLSTIELSTLGSVYFSQLTQFLPVIACDMTEIASHLSYGMESQGNDVKVSLAVPINPLYLTVSGANIHYIFTRNPSSSERRLLAALHQIFMRPLSHAVEFDRMKQLAVKDALTGLTNRNGYTDACTRKIHQANRMHSTFGLLVLDLDNFKQVNDKHGHLEGDRVLLKVASLMTQTIRGSEEAFRFGGDEFCTLVHTVTAEALARIAERLRFAITNNSYLIDMGISCSIGGALFTPSDDLKSLFDRADRALYQAKHAGKNLYQAA
jgi:diguanylate cyclase (GGDEF)-like protein